MRIESGTRHSTGLGLILLFFFFIVVRAKTHTKYLLAVRYDTMPTVSGIIIILISVADLNVKEVKKFIILIGLMFF